MLNCFLITAMPNKSMDVSAKQRLCLETCVVNSNGLSGGFAPRQFNRSAFLGCLTGSCYGTRKNHSH